MSSFETRWKSFWDRQTSSRHRSDDPQFLARYGAEIRILFPDPQPEAVLEIGCGAGELHSSFGFDRVDRYVGVDISQSILDAFEQRHPGVRTVTAGGHEYRDGESYDLIFSNGVIQFFTPRMLGDHFRHSASMLRSGGSLICASVPWQHLQMPYLRGEIRSGRQRGWAASRWRWLANRLWGSGNGIWYRLSDLEELGKRHGLKARFFGSMTYLHCIHAVFRHQQEPHGEP